MALKLSAGEKNASGESIPPFRCCSLNAEPLFLPVHTFQVTEKRLPQCPLSLQTEIVLTYYISGVSFPVSKYTPDGFVR